MSYEYRGPGVNKPPPKRSRKESRRPSPGQVEPAPVPSYAAPEPSARSGRVGRSPLQLFAALMGLIFLVLGIGGFIPGALEGSDNLETYGTESNAKLLDLFRVSVLHNIVHLVFAVGLLAAAQRSASRLYLLGGGIASLAIAAYGFVIDEASDANFLPTNDADNLLHVGLGGAMILLGLIGVAAERRS